MLGRLSVRHFLQSRMVKISVAWGRRVSDRASHTLPFVYAESSVCRIGTGKFCLWRLNRECGDEAGQRLALKKEVFLRRVRVRKG